MPERAIIDGLLNDLLSLSELGSLDLTDIDTRIQHRLFQIKRLRRQFAEVLRDIPGNKLGNLAAGPHWR
jgi:hypothetical protein